MPGEPWGASPACNSPGWEFWLQLNTFVAWGHTPLLFLFIPYLMSPQLGRRQMSQGLLSSLASTWLGQPHLIATPSVGVQASLLLPSLSHALSPHSSIGYCLEDIQQENEVPIYPSMASQIFMKDSPGAALIPQASLPRGKRDEPQHTILYWASTNSSLPKHFPGLCSLRHGVD